MKPLYFIINPNAKNGKCLKTWRKLEEELRGEEVAYSAFFTEYQGHAKELSKKIVLQANGEKTVIVAVGGDGTVNEVTNGVANLSNMIIGYIPAGSGNDFSRGFRIPNKPKEALTFLLTKLEQENGEELVDVGEVMNSEQEHIYFMSNMGVGFDAMVAKEANQSKMKAVLNRISLGKLVYVFFLLKTLLTFKFIRLEIEIDGKKRSFEKAWFVTVSNQPYFGGGMKISPDADPIDGLLNITVVHSLSKLKLLFVFISVFWGGHIGFKEVETFVGSAISVKSNEKCITHADGEIIGYSPLKIKACSRLLPIYKG